ncbi:YciI family protein [Halomonas heilongjiangensis]|uniref:Dehydrogenase n=1 Tax=Halomonas heilongjiangensis TaxID=1387883 RepID=A0A2N7TK04_9GAMM|nr:YciI family protein [Halomonas heilongjiangensis]PMR68510.1 dehydrogenase [Halomonas heilongjiangensis]PXX86669.1 dehydrogenase [Halomonas heilongjiangensis]
MKYVALVYYQESIINAMTEQEWHDLNQECVSGVERLTRLGHYLAGQALQPVDTATSVRVRDGEVLVADGPFAETKEQLAGFYLLDARDLDEALQLAGRIPPARFGTIEVRQVRELPPKDEGEPS